MRTRHLRNSDLPFTPLGIGAWAMGGGGWAFGGGPQDDEASIGATHAALDGGINWIATAAVYGFGHSEKVVARALQGGGGDRPYVFTTCGLVWDEKGQISRSLKRNSIRRECQAGLRRLQTDAIDLYRIHWPYPDAGIEEGWSAMGELRKAGKARRIGVSNFNAGRLARARAIAPVTSLQPPCFILSPEIETDILPFCGAHDIGVIVSWPMKSGMLTGAMTRERIAAMTDDDFRKRSPNFKEPLVTRNLGLADLLKTSGARHGRTAGEVAPARTLRRKEVTAAIVGMPSPKQVNGIVGAADFPLADAGAGEIAAFLQAPVPVQ